MLKRKLWMWSGTLGCLGMTLVGLSGCGKAATKAPTRVDLANGPITHHFKSLEQSCLISPENSEQRTLIAVRETGEGALTASGLTECPLTPNAPRRLFHISGGEFVGAFSFTPAVDVDPTALRILATGQ